MKKLGKYFFKYKLNIVIIILLLLLQVYCDLALPTYTSNIVNVGITKNGIEHNIFEYMSEETYLMLKNSLNIEEFDVIEKSYDLKNIKNNSLFDNDKILYVWNNKNLKELELITDKILENNIKNSLRNNENENKNENLNFDDKKIEIVKSSMIQEFIKKEYENIGINLNEFQMKFMKTYAIKMLIIAAIGSMSYIFLTYFSSKFSSNIAFDIRKDLFNKIIKFSNNEFNKYSTSTLITRTTNDVTQIQQFSNMMFRIMIYSPILGIGGIIKIIDSKTDLVNIIIISIIAIVCLMGIVFSQAIPRFKKVQKLIDKMNLIARENLSGMSVIRVFNNQKYQENKFDLANQEFYQNNLVANIAVLSAFPIINFVMNIVSVMIVYKGAYIVEQGYAQVGDIMAFIQYSMQIIMSFLMVSMIFGMFPRAMVSTNRIFEVLNENITIKDVENSEYISEISEIEFKNVSMSFENNKVLNNINFHIKKGQTLGIIGSTGSGKSTILNLLVRFFDVSEGEILINGKNIKNLNIKNLRDKISYAQQKNILFSGTIKENILDGNQRASNNDILNVTEIANAIDFINEKENKFDEIISQGGANFSGGQKQRLSLSRALVKEADVYMLDDTFNALDYKTTSNILKSISKIFIDKISIIVSQRIGTIENADVIIVLDSGNIVGIGTHEELVENCGIYRQISNAQSRS